MKFNGYDILHEADLRGAEFWCANLQGADLKGADLRSADLRGADLRGADLRGAKLQSAYLVGADLQRAYLQGANLQGANLRAVDLRCASLRGANLQGAYLQSAIGNLAEVKSLLIEQWPVVWAQSPEGETLVWIGCECHTLDKWKSADGKWLKSLDRKAPYIWNRLGAHVLAIIEASPAVPWAIRGINA